MVHNRSSVRRVVQKEISYYVDQYLSWGSDEYAYDDASEIGDEAGWGACTREADDPDLLNWKPWDIDCFFYLLRGVRSYNSYRRSLYTDMSRVREGIVNFGVRISDYVRPGA